MNTNTTLRTHNPNDNSVLRGIQILLGVWLFISAFIWPHTMAQRTNAWICGLIAIAFAVIAMREPRARWVNTALSIWLFLSTIAMPRVSVGTVWNGIIVAVAMFVISLTAGTWRPQALRHA